MELWNQLRSQNIKVPPSVVFSHTDKWKIIFV